MITQSKLKEFLKYDPETGDFIRVAGWGKGRKAGTVVNVYVQIMLDYKKYYAHNLAYLYMNGRLPYKELEHKNFVRYDNKWSNIVEKAK